MANAVWVTCSVCGGIFAGKKGQDGLYYPRMHKEPNRYRFDRYLKSVKPALEPRCPGVLQPVKMEVEPNS